jgi:hypothetical protein
MVCYVTDMTETLTTTRTIIVLPSGNVGEVVYSATFGDIAIITLLLILVVFQALVLWRYKRIGGM